MRAKNTESKMKTRCARKPQGNIGEMDEEDLSHLNSTSRAPDL